MNTLHRKAFTLVELLIAIAVFSILVAVGVGGFVHALHTQRQVAALIAAQSNASLALEQMAREIRTGYLFCDMPGTSPAIPNSACQLSATGGCSVNGSTWTCDNILDFYNASGENIDYRLDNGELQKSTNGSAGPFAAITASNVKVAYLIFTIFGNTEGDHWPPRVTISLGVAPNSNDPALVSNILSFQTTLSARQVDCTQTSPASC